MEQGRATSGPNAGSTCHKLEGYDRDVFSGYLDVGNGKTSQLFFFLYPAKSGAKVGVAPLIMWLQGGPGCASTMGNVNEFGPFTLTCSEDGTCSEEPRDNSWNDDYSLLIIDQPIGTGYSPWTPEELVTTTEEAASDLYNALINLFSLGSDTDCNAAAFVGAPFFVFGESYAGHWVPGTSIKILEENAKTPAPEIKINLKGKRNSISYFRICNRKPLDRPS